MGTLISVVAPCFNDAENTPELVRRLNAVAEQAQLQFEIILVDDGSPDNGWAVIRELADRFEHVHGIRLSRNFGQHIALTAGIARARGDYIVIMDGDLQDRPEGIPDLYTRIRDGYDLVFTVRRERQDRYLRRLASILYRCVINTLSGLQTPHNIAMMRIFSREFANRYLQFSEKHRSIGALFSWMGFSWTSIEVQHDRRFSGRSNFTVRKLLLRAYNNICSFSTIPIAMIGYLGLIISGLSFVFGLFIVIRFLMGLPNSQAGWPSIICSITFSTGIIMLSLAIIGKYIGNIYIETLNRPLYFIAEQTPGTDRSQPPAEERDANGT